MSAGMKTTEFWLSLAATVLGAVVGSGLLGDSTAMKIAGLAVSVLAALGYTASRTRVKLKP